MTKRKRPSRREQAGWSEVRNKTQGAKPPGFVPNRSEASRCEQARRDKEEASEPLRTARMDRSEG